MHNVKSTYNLLMFRCIFLSLKFRNIHSFSTGIHWKNILYLNCSQQKSTWLLSCATPVKKGRSWMRKIPLEKIIYFVGWNIFFTWAPSKIRILFPFHSQNSLKIPCKIDPIFHVIIWSKLALFLDGNWTRWPPKVLCNQNCWAPEATVQNDFFQIVKKGIRRGCLGFNCCVCWHAVSCWSKFSHC